MAKINGSVLRELRESQNLTLEALSDKSGVDESTIHRLESGARKGDRCRRHTVDGICRALNVTPEILAGTVAGTIGRTEPESAKDQLNVRIDNGARNSLNLVAIRYGVSTARIVELAPLLFYVAAEKSLSERRLRVEEVWKVESQWEELRNSIPQLPGRAMPIDTQWLGERAGSRFGETKTSRWSGVSAGGPASASRAVVRQSRICNIG